MLRQRARRMVEGSGKPMRLARTLGIVLALVACAPGAPPAASPSVSDTPCKDTTTATSPTAKESSAAADPCDAERTTPAIESCLTEGRRQIETDIRAALTRATILLSAGGGNDAAALVAASQDDWERYRSAQCALFEKLSEGGSMARIAVAYCRRDLAATRLSDLRKLEDSVAE
jgi:uncharacterized protein YecT (DUF1311 family)